MFSNEGLKGIIEFILEKQNDCIVTMKKHDDNFDRVEDELVELRKLPRKFEDLKRYKKEILEDLTKRVNDHEDRITTLEASHDELRANNDKDHQQMVLNIHDNQVQCLRDAE